MLFTPLTDSMDLYRSRLAELRERHGPYTGSSARAVDLERYLAGDRHRRLRGARPTGTARRIHNLKYFTWVEQQGKPVEELDAQWSDEGYWRERMRTHEAWDRLIEEFNQRTGLLERYR